MGFRLQTLTRICQGLTLKLRKSDTLWTVGGRAVSINVLGDKVTGDAVNAGFGIYCQERLDALSANPNPENQAVAYGSSWLRLSFSLVWPSRLGIDSLA